MDKKEREKIITWVVCGILILDNCEARPHNSLLKLNQSKISVSKSFASEK